MANGLASLLGYKGGNPFLDGIAANRSALLMAGAGLAGGGPDFGHAVSSALLGAGQGQSLDQQRAEQAKQAADENLTANWLKANYPQYAGLPVSQGFQLAMKDAGGASGNPATFSQTPVFLTDGKNVHAAQMSSNGGIFVDGKTLPGIPNGWSVVARPDNLSMVDFGGYKAPFDPNSGTVGTAIPVQGSPSTNMDVTMNPDGSRTMAPAGGSDEAIKRRGNQTSAQTALSSLEQKQGVVATNIDRALQIAQSVPATGIASIANAIPGTPQYDLKTTLDTIKANIGFDQLQQMRDNSPTGGALGQVSEQENRLLQAVLGSLDQAQSQEQFIANLTFLKQILAQSTDARRRAFAQDFPGVAPAMSPVGAGPRGPVTDMGNGITIEEIP